MMISIRLLPPHLVRAGGESAKAEYSEGACMYAHTHWKSPWRKAVRGARRGDFGGKTKRREGTELSQGMGGRTLPCTPYDHKQHCVGKLCCGAMQQRRCNFRHGK